MTPEINFSVSCSQRLKYKYTQAYVMSVNARMRVAYNFLSKKKKQEDTLTCEIFDWMTDFWKKRRHKSQTFGQQSS